jgi:hypothetical protein
MPISFNPEFSDVLSDNYVGGAISVTTSQIEAKVGASRLAGREYLMIHNNGTQTIFFGPSGVTTSNGIPILKNQSAGFPAGDLGVFVVSASGMQDVRVQEFA